MNANGDKIILEGMQFYGYHGARLEERALGQRFVVDMEIGIDLAHAGRTDDLAYTLDYGEILHNTKRILEGEPMKLLEAVAERVARATLKYDAALWVRVRVRKPSVAIEGAILAASAVEIVRFRDDGAGGA